MVQAADHDDVRAVKVVRPCSPGRVAAITSVTLVLFAAAGIGAYFAVRQQGTSDAGRSGPSTATGSGADANAQPSLAPSAGPTAVSSRFDLSQVTSTLSSRDRSMVDQLRVRAHSKLLLEKSCLSGPAQMMAALAANSTDLLRVFMAITGMSAHVLNMPTGPDSSGGGDYYGGYEAGGYQAEDGEDVPHGRLLTGAERQAQALQWDMSDPDTLQRAMQTISFTCTWPVGRLAALAFNMSTTDASNQGMVAQLTGGGMADGVADGEMSMFSDRRIPPPLNSTPPYRVSEAVAIDAPLCTAFFSGPDTSLAPAPLDALSRMYVGLGISGSSEVIDADQAFGYGGVPASGMGQYNRAMYAHLLQLADRVPGEVMRFFPPPAPDQAGPAAALRFCGALYESVSRRLTTSVIQSACQSALLHTVYSQLGRNNASATIATLEALRLTPADSYLVPAAAVGLAYRGPAEWAATECPDIADTVQSMRAAPPGGTGGSRSPGGRSLRGGDVPSMGDILRRNLGA